MAERNEPELHRMRTRFLKPDGSSMTLAEVAARHGQSVGLPQFVGTALSVADQMEAFVDHAGGDGFMLSPIHSPVPSNSSSTRSCLNFSGAAATARNMSAQRSAICCGRLCRANAMTEAIRCSIIRGGTSKGVYLKESDLPRDAEARDRAILEIFGSPDKRQINGLGGADPLTSKVCVVGPPPADGPDCHLTYTFGQVEIDEPYVDYHSLCGNLTAGVGAFAIWENMVRATDPVTEVRIYNTNLESLIIAKCPSQPMAAQWKKATTLSRAFPAPARRSR